MKINPENYQRGLALVDQLHGNHSGETIVNALKEICPDYATMTIEWGFGEVFARDGLDIKMREFVVIAACVTLGHVKPQLQAHIEAALNVGATPEEIIELIVQVALYAGFPAATNALFAAKEVFDNVTTGDNH